jgi:hypothetical protein
LLVEFSLVRRRMLLYGCLPPQEDTLCRLCMLSLMTEGLDKYQPCGKY